MTFRKVICVTMAAAAIPNAIYGAIELVGLSVAVESGLSVEPIDMTLLVKPGSALVAGKAVTVADETLITVEQAESESVTDEELTLGDSLPAKWHPGTGLKACTTFTPLPGCLDPDSLKVQLIDGTPLVKDKDFLLEPVWGRLARVNGGAVESSETKVLASYAARMMRLDALCVNADGKVSLIKGVADKAMPAPPKPPAGSAAIAHVYLPHGCRRIDVRQVLPIGKPFPELREADIKERGMKFVPKTLAKLQSGEPVTVVTWGDSVTAGGDASRPELRFADQFAIRLRERYPKSEVRHVNAGIGATNTVMRLPKLKEEVLAHKPDLVTIEFVNDMMLSEEIVRKNWNSAIDQITSAGAEVIVVTAHFVMPEMMGKKEPFGGETRPFTDWLRDIAAKRNAALADTSKRWAHLEAEGIPYVTMLANGINHPDDRGHELFVKDLMSFFPPTE